LGVSLGIDWVSEKNEEDIRLYAIVGWAGYHMDLYFEITTGWEIQ
jgi:hypothetical protein